MDARCYVRRVAARVSSRAVAVQFLTEVAKALDFAHAHYVVHRDVKPANFLLSVQSAAITAERSPQKPQG